MLLATINSGTLIIALPDLERALGTSLLQLVWVILAYMIASTVLVLTAGRLSDLFGRKHAYVGGFVVFALASLGAGFAGSGTELILWRIVQGIGGAFLFANAGALVTDAFPREQLGVAMGTNTMVAAIGLVLGPVLGGVLVSLGWQWVFWFNVPLALAGSLWAGKILHELAKRDDVARHARRLARRRLVGRQARLAHAGRSRHGRQRDRAGRHDRSRHPLQLLGQHPVAVRRRRGLGHVQQPEHRGDDGNGPGPP